VGNRAFTVLVWGKVTVKTLQVHKAQGFRENGVESVTLILDTEVPNFRELNEYRDFYDAEAEQILEVLKHLPGGTVDRVIGKLLMLKASLLAIPLFEEPKGGDAGE
jgi:hypothetical protein